MLLLPVALVVPVVLLPTLLPPVAPGVVLFSVPEVEKARSNTKEKLAQRKRALMEEMKAAA